MYALEKEKQKCQIYIYKENDSNFNQSEIKNKILGEKNAKNPNKGFVL